MRAYVASLRRSVFGCSVGACSGGSASRIRRRPRLALAWRRRPLLPALSLASCSKHKSRGGSSLRSLSDATARNYLLPLPSAALSRNNPLRSLPAPPPETASFRSLTQPWPVTTPSAPFRRHRPKLPPVAAVHMATQSLQQNGA